MNEFETAERFDYVILNDVIEHLSDRELNRLLHSCKKLLSARGEIVMHTPNGRNLYCQTDKTLLSRSYFYWYRRITKETYYKSSAQIYCEQVHINVKSYRKWRELFKSNGFSLSVEYDKEGGSGLFTWEGLKELLSLNNNMMLIARNTNGGK